MKFPRLKTTALIALTTFTLSVSQPSHALVGLASWNPILMGTGLAYAVGGILVTSAAGLPAGVHELTGGNLPLEVAACVVGCPIGFAGALAGMYGMILLDGEAGASVAFTELKEKDAFKLGITKKERKAYNLEIDQVNFVVSEVNDELSSLHKPTAKDSQRAWEKVQHSLSDDTMIALLKIHKQWIK